MSRLVVGTGRWHTYSLDGQRVPSVTTIIGKATAKQALVGWAAREAAAWALAHRDEVEQLGEAAWLKQAAAASDAVRDASMVAGTAVHSIAERLIFGEPVETTDPDTGEPYPDDVVRMGEQVARFLDAWDVTPDTALVEAPIFHEGEQYAGKFDLCAILRGGDRWLIDYKSGASGIWPETALQLTAYARATHVVIGERDMLMPPVDRCAALWVRPDGWQLVPVASGDEVWSTFRHMIPVAAFAGRRRDDVIGGALPVPEEVDA